MGAFEESGTLKSILLRFHDAFIPYSKEEFVVTDYEALLSAYKPLKLSGKATIVERFETAPSVQLGAKNEMYFCECLNDSNLPSTPIHETIKLASLDDIERIMQLRSSIDEFPTAHESEKMLRQAIETNTGRTYYIEKDGAIIASASTSAENSLSTMVVGVCTHPNYRGNGYASFILQKMIQDFTKEGRTLCLFYNNPAAGRIYKRLGLKILECGRCIDNKGYSIYRNSCHLAIKANYKKISHRYYEDGETTCEAMTLTKIC